VAQSIDEVREAFEELLTAMNEGDAARMSTGLSTTQPTVHIGTDPAEWRTSEQLISGVTAERESPRVSAALLDLSIYEVGGDAAWVAGHGSLTLADEEQPVRMSGLLRRENNRWALVHSHVSIGVLNEQLFATIGGDRL
jgi:ketosteroid isomerase-like protein